MAKTKSRILTINPAKAEQLLRKNFVNRKLSKATVETYARDMIRGKWQLGAPIMFDVSGRLIQGQHRLKAVIRADKTIQFVCLYNMPKSSAPLIDVGKNWNTKDSALEMGVTGITGKITATARAMWQGLHRSRFIGFKVSRIEEIEFIKKYREALEFACKHLPNKQGIASAQTRAVIARAFYHVESEWLEMFCEILCSGLPQSNEDHVIIKIRDKLMNLQQHDRTTRDIVYKVCERGLKAYVEGEGLPRLTLFTHEAFPIEEDDNISCWIKELPAEED